MKDLELRYYINKRNYIPLFYFSINFVRCMLKNFSSSVDIIHLNASSQNQKP